MVKKKWYYALVIVLLVAFLIPKNAGYGGRGGWGAPVWQDKNCSCLGFKFELRTFDGPTFYSCSGIPISCQCFENKIEEGTPLVRKEIECQISHQLLW